MGSDSRTAFPLRPVTLIFLLLTYCIGAGTLEARKNESPVEALVGQNVTMPCHLSGHNDGDLDLMIFSVRWTQITINGTSKLVYDFQNLLHKPSRIGSRIQDHDLRRGNASLSIPYVEFSDEGTYKCTVIITPDKAEATSTMQVSAKPTCAVSDPRLVMNPGTDKSVTCYVNKFYPELVGVSWAKRSKHHSKKTALDSDTCKTVPVRNADGTFNVTNVLSVKTVSKDEDGDVYFCIVEHRSLKHDLTLNFTLTVQEPESIYVILGLVLVILVILLLLPLSIYLIYYKKEPPTVSKITEIQLIHMETATLPCYISGFRPKYLDIRLYLRVKGEEKEIYSWNSKDSGKESQNIQMEVRYNDEDTNIPLLENGSTDSNLLRATMENVVKAQKRGIFNCNCLIRITPVLPEDNDAVLTVKVNHAALKSPISQVLNLKVDGAPPKLSSIKAPQYYRHGERVALICHMTQFFPEKLHYTWEKEDLMKHKPLLMICDSEKTYCDKYTLDSKKEYKDHCHSLHSTLTFQINVKEDHRVKYICIAKHLATNQTARSYLEMDVMAEPVLDSIQSMQNNYHAGDQMELTCRIHSFHPKLFVVKWYKENVVLSSPNDEALRDENGLFYVLSSVKYTIKEDDFGKTFSCEVDHQSINPTAVEWKLEKPGPSVKNQDMQHKTAIHP